MAREGGILAILMLLLLCFETTQSTTYIVGGDEGWSPIVSMEAWSLQYKFFAGDILVDQNGHDTCTISGNSQSFHSGHDEIPLSFGANYFIDSNPEDCQNGMKLSINATARPTPPTAAVKTQRLV
uniref:Phytocyanin domain-containing protein n=1 Tax=Manihot esculenta TaxID=3983 RepID=A0A2C9V750_MANES